MHDVPSMRQVKHVPLRQLALQQSESTPHAAPAAVQPPASVGVRLLHVPPRQSAVQQSESTPQASPTAPQLGPLSPVDIMELLELDVVDSPHSLAHIDAAQVSTAIAAFLQAIAVSR